MYIKIACFSLILASVVASAKTVVPIETWATKNGVKVYFVQLHEIPIVDIGVVFDAGAARDGKQAGIATLTNALLDEGTAKQSDDQISQSFEKVGAKFNSNVELDYALVTLRSLADKHFLMTAVDTFADVINIPSFPNDHVARMKKQMVSALQAEQQQPGVIAQNALFKAIYNGGPYGHSVLGSLQSVAALDKREVQNFYHQYYVAANTHIVLVGDLTRKDAEKIAEKIVGKLPQGHSAQVLASAENPAKMQLENIRFPSAQTHVLIGQRAIERTSPDYFPLSVGNYILGGGALTSRLFESVRQKEGLAYSVFSYFNAMIEKGPFVIGLQTRNKEATHAIKVARKTLEDFVTTGPSDDELRAAKNNIINGFPLRLASNAAVLQNVIGLTTYKLPLNYFDTYCDNVNAVSKDNIKSAFQRVIDPTKLVTITVGNSVF